VTVPGLVPLASALITVTEFSAAFTALPAKSVKAFRNAVRPKPFSAPSALLIVPLRVMVQRLPSLSRNSSGAMIGSKPV
jgi:hypothetical protein